jgi:catechol 2,3-dioxygenase
LYHFALLVPDRSSLGRFVRQLTEIGVHFASADHAVSEALYLWDPDGLGIEVYADRPRDAWRLQGREIFMTTERLDLTDLETAAGETSWTGLPAGTVMGHMHLQVSDLESAERFFHTALGFDKMVWSFPGALFLSAGGYHHHLGTNTWAAGAGLAQENEARLLEWEIVLPAAEDRDRAAHSLQAAGFDVTQEGESRVVSDPWNTTLRLV